MPLQPAAATTWAASVISGRRRERVACRRSTWKYCAGVEEYATVHVALGCELQISLQPRTPNAPGPALRIHAGAAARAPSPAPRRSDLPRETLIHDRFAQHWQSRRTVPPHSTKSVCTRPHLESKFKPHHGSLGQRTVIDLERRPFAWQAAPGAWNRLARHDVVYHRLAMGRRFRARRPVQVSRTTNPIDE